MQTYNCGCQAAGAKVVASGTNYVVNFNGNISILAQAPKILADGTTLVEMLVKSHVTSGKAAAADLKVMLDDARQGQAPASSYRMSPGQMGGRQEVNMYLLLDAPALFPGKVLRSKGLATLSAETPTFPPVNQTYQLAKALEFEDPNTPGPVLARIDTFPVVVNPSP